MKQVIVTGGRDYDGWDVVKEALNFIKPDVVIQGGATGADYLAKRWAIENSVIYHTESADWNKYGKAAGPRRNRAMLDKYPDAIVVAFPGGDGTADCVRAAFSKRRMVLQVIK